MARHKPEIHNATRKGIKAGRAQMRREIIDWLARRWLRSLVHSDVDPSVASTIVDIIDELKAGHPRR